VIDLIVDAGVTTPGETSSGDGEEPLPTQSRIRQAVELACCQVAFPHEPQLCIRFSDDTTVQALNHQWRERDSVTDVLSFPMQEPDDLQADESLGDIIIAVPFTAAEAERLRLPIADHMLHLIVHATLHLLGYDHIKDEDASVMHAQERKVMQQLALHDPYPDEEGSEETEEEEMNG